MSDSTPHPPPESFIAMPTPETGPDVVHTIDNAPNATPALPVRDQRPQQQVRDGPIDPRVSELRAMFPDYDDLVLQSVLESVQGNQDRAVDLLLRLSDPEYRGDPEPAVTVAPQPQHPMSQTDLDEQYARQLLQEEQQQQQQAWQARQQQQQRRPNTQQQPGAQQGGDTMAEIQQQFTKIAETGKKTFGTIFSKVKAKIQDIDQQRQGQGSTHTPAPSRWNTGPNDGYDPAQYEQQTYQYQSPQPPYATRPQRQPQQPSPPPLVSQGPAPPTNDSAQTVRGYDAAPEHVAATESGSAPSGAVNAASSSATSPRSIDGGKFGLLPKRPVSLLRPQSPGTSAVQPIERQESRDDDDGLEYTENPFEEGKK